MATVADVLTPLRALLRDPATANVNLFSDAELFVYISDGTREAQRQLKNLDQNFGTVEVDFNMVANQQVYDSGDILGMAGAPIKAPISMYRLGIGPEPINIPFLRGGWQEFRRWELGTPYLNGQACLRVMLVGEEYWFAPTPTESVTAGLRLRYEQQLVPVGGFTSDADDLLVPEDWIEFIRWDAQAKAMNQNEDNPGTVWQMRQAVLKSLLRDFSARLNGQEVETVQGVFDPDPVIGPWGMPGI